MKIGQRVEITEASILQGIRATVVVNPGSGQHERKYDGLHQVWLKFDQDDAHLGSEHGFAVLQEQWFLVEHLRVIE